MIKASVKAECKALEAAHGAGFKVVDSRQDAWRLRFEVAPYTPEEGFTRWDETEIQTWVRSVAYENGLEPGTVRKVCARIQRGTALVGLTADLLKSPQWNLRPVQAIALLAAIDKLKATDTTKNWGTTKHEPIKRFLRSPAAIQLDLTAYWPKVLEPGRRTARSSRYPFETPLVALSGWNKIEDVSAIPISTESKLRALKALGQQSIALVTGASAGATTSDQMSGAKWHMQNLVDWMQRHVLELVPELQQALFVPEEDGGAMAPSPAAAPTPAALIPGASSGPSPKPAAKAVDPVAVPAARRPPGLPVNGATAKGGKKAGAPAQDVAGFWGVPEPKPLLASDKNPRATPAAPPARTVAPPASAATPAAPAAPVPAPAKGRSKAGVCFKFQKGRCNRGDECRFSHEVGQQPQQQQQQQQQPAAAAAAAAIAAVPAGLPAPISAKAQKRKDDLARLHGAQLKENFLKQQKRPEYQKMLKIRKTLPSLKMETEVTDAIRSHQVVVISGATGCGKSTQIPQFILDDALLGGRGASAGIICTQPRRLAAIGVGERVASERAEKIGDTVGYQIRLESKRSKATRLLFCTTGILLRTLEGDADLEDFGDGTGVSHVIVDEVHERSIDSDFLLIILRELLMRRPDIKLVLMSATLNAGLFAEYFRKFKTVVIDIPGRTFPVERFYLEDTVQACRYELKPGSDFARKPARGGGGGGKGGKGKGKGKPAGADLEFGVYAENWVDEFDGPQALNEAIGRKYAKACAATIKGMKLTTINNELVAALVAHIAVKGKNAGMYGASAILVFVPGLKEITDLFNEMKQHPVLQDPKYRILPLHSALPTHEQKAVFDTPPNGTTKIVLSTNIAETSVTINDISVVVDCGTHKEMQYDPGVGMSCLREVRVSKANASQRAGRAGRVREGSCFSLFLRKELDVMPAQQLPEMLRCPLESIALRIKTLKLGTIGGFLSKAIEPPSPDAISHVSAVLSGLNALDTAGDKEELTALGVLLAKLPVDPRIGKMMLFGAIFRCSDPILIIASSLAFRSPFFSPFDKRDEADAVKKSFDTESGSDHITLLKAYQGWEQSRSAGGKAAERRYLSDNFLSGNTLRMIGQMKSQFQQQLREIGFYNRKEAAGANQNSDNLGLVKAVLVAGLYPNVVKIEPPKGNGGGGGGKKKPGRPSPPKLSTRKLWEKDAKEEMVSLHPSSVLAGQTTFAQPFLLFHEKVKTSAVYVRDASVVSPFALLLFGGKVNVEHLKGEVTLDNWLKFSVSALNAAMILKMREKLMACMEKKISDPKCVFFLFFLRGHLV